MYFYIINDLNLFHFILLIIGFPFYAIGKILNFPSYYYGKRVADNTCKNIEFYAAVSFGVGSIVWQVTFLLELILSGFLFKSWAIIGFYAFIKIFCGWLGLQYSPFKKRMLGAFRLSKLKKEKPAIYQSLFGQRSIIIKELL